MSSYKDKVVLITGGSAGLGLVLAREWGLGGARIVMVARNRNRLDQAANALREEEIEIMTYAADITEWQQVTEMRRWFDREYDALDVLVNAAGRSDRGRVADVPVETFESIMRLNFLATAHCCHTFIAPLLASHGSIVNIGSLASKVATPYLGAYPPSKFAVAAYSQQLRLENPGLHVLLVCPGPIRRDDAGSRYEKEARHLPSAARQPGGGAPLNAVAADHLARRIIRACQRRQPELVVPSRARLLFALSQLSPRWGDWLLRKLMKSD